MSNSIIYFRDKYNNNKCLLIIINFHIITKYKRHKKIIFRPIILYIPF